jgi:hypothetical protein
MLAVASGDHFPTDSQWGRLVEFVGGAVMGTASRGAAGPKRCGGGEGRRPAIGAASQGRRHPKQCGGRDGSRPERDQPKVTPGDRGGRRWPVASESDRFGEVATESQVRFFLSVLVFLIDRRTF